MLCVKSECIDFVNRPAASVASPLRKFSSYLYNTLDNRVHKPLQSLNHHPQAMIVLEICIVLIIRLSVTALWNASATYFLLLFDLDFFYSSKQAPRKTAET